MSDDLEFESAVSNAAFYAGLLAIPDVEPFEKALRTFHAVDSVGHILNPTAYRDKMEDREAIREWLSALVKVQRAARAFVAKRAELLLRRERFGGSPVCQTYEGHGKTNEGAKCPCRE